MKISARINEHSWTYVSLSLSLYIYIYIYIYIPKQSLIITQTHADEHKHKYRHTHTHTHTPYLCMCTSVSYCQWVPSNFANLQISNDGIVFRANGCVLTTAYVPKQNREPICHHFLHQILTLPTLLATHGHLRSSLRVQPRQMWK